MVEWVNVIGQIPVPSRAHDADADYRKVQLRLWKVEGADRPYVLQARLVEGDQPLEQWTRDYSRNAGTQASTAYDLWLQALGEWMDGRTQLHEIRPQKIVRRPGWIEGTPWGVA